MAYSVEKVGSRDGFNQLVVMRAANLLFLFTLILANSLSPFPFGVFQQNRPIAASHDASFLVD
jgi:hypothetical protein